MTEPYDPEVDHDVVDAHGASGASEPQDDSEANDEPLIVPADDNDVVQAVVLAAAINGDNAVRAQLPAIQSAFDEPYRTVAGILIGKVLEGNFMDKHTLEAALGACHLIRQKPHGVVETLTAEQVVNLIFASEVQPGQGEAYLQTLQLRLQAKRQDEFKDRAAELAKAHGGNPEQLLAQVEKLAADARHGVGGGAGKYPSELLELLPYANTLATQQKGAEYLGLDSGFDHYNAICNGVYTGLTVLAAPPGKGKTTLLWQIACQVAQRNKVPVIFISMEQSKEELRAKALARIAKLQHKHILRGRLRSDDPEQWGKLLQAIQEYMSFSRYLTIVEGDDTTTIDTIAEVAAAKMAQMGADRCLVALDYLQILPTRSQDTDRVTSIKDRVDLHVSALRRIARRLCSPVIAISSENRSGYGSKGLDVFKESGGIEYSADIAMILTRSRQGGPAKDAEYKPLDLNIIKNRNGETGVVQFKFYAKRMEFVETGRGDWIEEDEE